MPLHRLRAAVALALCATLWLLPFSKSALGQLSAETPFDQAVPHGPTTPDWFPPAEQPLGTSAGDDTFGPSRPDAAEAGFIQRVFFQIEERPELDVPVQRGPELDMPFRPLTPPRLPVEGEEPKEPKWFEKMRITGYAQFRYNNTVHRATGSAPPHHAGDSSVSPNENFLVRRARLVFAAEVSDYVSVYLQPDFASSVPGSPDANHFVQMRDWYGDVYFDTAKEYRVRVGQSKIPYGWENMQSSSRRAPLDRNDAFNSATRNERDVGAFFYWTPEYVQEVFGYLSDENLKPSGDYGALGIGVYNGQGGSFREQNDNVHFVSRFTWPFVFADSQILELGIQGYTGDYVVLGSSIRPLGVGPAIVPAGTRDEGGRQGHVDQRLGWTAVLYPQPIGVQAEWTIGRGPALNAEQTALERRSLYGGYVMLIAKEDTDCWGTWFPFIRWQHFRGGYKSARNAPYSRVDELELGVEWQIRPEMEWATMYVFTDRTNLEAFSGAGQRSYEQFDGQLVRTQFQVNY